MKNLCIRPHFQAATRPPGRLSPPDSSGSWDPARPQPRDTGAHSARLNLPRKPRPTSPPPLLPASPLLLPAPDPATPRPRDPGRRDRARPGPARHSAQAQHGPAPPRPAHPMHMQRRRPGAVQAHRRAGNGAGPAGVGPRERRPGAVARGVARAEPGQEAGDWST